MPKSQRNPVIRNLDRLTGPVLDRILSLEQACFPDPWTPAMFQVADHEQILVAEWDGRLVGYLCLHRILDEAHILNIAVDPAWRRRGIGRRLVETVMSMPDVRDLFLEVRPGNEPALALYRKLGFVPIGRRARYYRDGEDALVMHCSLPQGAPRTGDDPPA